jgi:hypothetical protein
MKLFEEFKQVENMWDKLVSLTESTTIYTDDGKIAARFYSANESVQNYVDEVGPHEGGYTLIKTFWLPTNRGKLNVGLISIDETGGEDGMVCIPSYDVQFIAPFDEAEDVYDMLYESEPFDDIDAFIAKFVPCSYARSVERLLDSGVGHLTEGITNKVLTWTCFFDDKEIGTVEAATEEEALEKMQDKYPEYNYSMYDGCFYVNSDVNESLKESVTDIIQHWMNNRLAATVAEEFKLYENLFEETTGSKKHPWMKDVPLVYPELNLGSDPTDPEDDMLIKDFTYLEGPEDVAEVLDNLITEEDVADTGYDFQTIKTDCDAWYDFLDANFDKLVTKYDEELLNAFEDRAIKAAIREAEDDYYNGNSEYIHETLVPDHDADIKIVKDVRNLLKELGSGESYIHGSWNQDFVILAGEDRTNSRLRNALKNLGCTELANAHDVNKLLIPKTFKHTDNSLDEAAESGKISAKSECVYLIRHEDGKRSVAVKRDENNNIKSVYVNGKAFLDSICYFNTRDEAIRYMNKVAKKLPYEDTLLKIVKANADLNGYLEVDTKFGKCLIKASTLNEGARSMIPELDADNYLDFDFAVVSDGNQLAKVLTRSFAGINNTYALEMIKEMLDENKSLKNSAQKWIYDLLDDVVSNMSACYLKGTKPGVKDAYQKITSYGLEDINEVWELFIDGVRLYKFGFDGKYLYYFLDMTIADVENMLVDDEY